MRPYSLGLLFSTAYRFGWIFPGGDRGIFPQLFPVGFTLAPGLNPFKINGLRLAGALTRARLGGRAGATGGVDRYRIQLRPEMGNLALSSA